MFPQRKKGERKRFEKFSLNCKIAAFIMGEMYEAQRGAANKLNLKVMNYNNLLLTLDTM
jgi:hypothetical protein